MAVWSGGKLGIGAMVVQVVGRSVFGIAIALTVAIASPSQAVSERFRFCQSFGLTGVVLIALLRWWAYGGWW